jgi:hypothetical protein
MTTDSTFQCPNCGGTIDYNGAGITVRCTFCGNSVMVPEELRPKPAPMPDSSASQVQIYIQPPASGAAPARTRASSGGGIWIGIGVLVLLAIVGGLLLSQPGVRSRLGLAAATLTPTPTPLPSPTPIARSVLSFGQEGSGAGYFNDPRSLAVDAQGRIFVGDYLPGRIQAFAADGTFLWQQSVTGKSDYVAALAADLQGRLYAVVGGNIDVYDAASGTMLSTWKPGAQQVGYYQALAVTPQGDVLAVMERELVRLDAQGKLLMQVGGLQEDFIKIVGAQDSAGNITGMAVDGSGNIYVSVSGGFVLKLAADGSLIDRLNGVAAGEAINAIAVDGQGRVAWAYSDQVALTDGSGRLVSQFKSGSLIGMQFNLKGQLVGLHTLPPKVEVFSFGP